MPVVLRVEDLIHGRPKAVQIMLRPLGHGGKPVPCRFVPHPRCKIICAHGSGVGSDYADSWFPTHASPKTSEL